MCVQTLRKQYMSGAQSVPAPLTLHTDTPSSMMSSLWQKEKETHRATLTGARPTWCVACCLRSASTRGGGGLGSNICVCGYRPPATTSITYIPSQSSAKLLVELVQILVVVCTSQLYTQHIRGKELTGLLCPLYLAQGKTPNMTKGNLQRCSCCMNADNDWCYMSTKLQRSHVAIEIHAAHNCCLEITPCVVKKCCITHRVYDFY